MAAQKQRAVVHFLKVAVVYAEAQRAPVQETLTVKKL
jgi:hypothetical protein